MRRNASLALASVLIFGMAASPLAAQMRGRGWGGGGWGGPGFDEPLRPSWRGLPQANPSDPRAPGKIDVERFVSRAGLDRLGKGPVAVKAVVSGISDDGAAGIYEAALVDQLVNDGYDTLHPDNAAGQHAELQIVREVAVPAEQKRSPVSGAAELGVSNRGSYYGLALNLDFTKPRPAVLSTRMNARILDDASGAVLWEGHALLYSLDGEDGGEAQVARQLITALFADFPEGKGDTLVD